MKIVQSIGEMSTLCRAVKINEQRLGFVPTMGALHAGHLALVRAARAQCENTAVSIFVNPTQFGPNEDFTRYPRNLEHDQKLLEAEGISLLFVPTVEQMYPPGASTFVTVEELSGKLCEPFAQLHAPSVNIFEELFILDDIQEFERNGAGQWAAAERSSVHTGRDFGGNRFRCKDGAEGQTRGERLGDQSNVRLG